MLGALGGLRPLRQQRNALGEGVTAPDGHCAGGHSHQHTRGTGPPSRGRAPAQSASPVRLQSLTPARHTPSLLRAPISRCQRLLRLGGTRSDSVSRYRSRQGTPAAPRQRRPNETATFLAMRSSPLSRGERSQGTSIVCPKRSPEHALRLPTRAALSLRLWEPAWGFSPHVQNLEDFF